MTLHSRVLRSFRKRTATALILVAAALVVDRASAEPSATEKATAEALFDQAKELMKTGHEADACPKLAESQRLDPGVGTLLNLADCFERTGKTASAWATFREANALARVGGDARRELLARDRAARLEGQVPRLVVNVPDLPGLTVTDGTNVLAKATWGAPLPVDPGPHTIVARAPGYRDATVSVTVANGERKSADIPSLEKVEATPPPETPPEVSKEPPKVVADLPPADAKGRVGTRTYVTYGVAGTGLVVGTIFGLTSLSKTSDIKGGCTGNVCPTSASGDIGSANTLAWVSDIGLGVGVVAAAVGTYFLFSDLSHSPAAPTTGRVTPTVSLGNGAGSLGLRGNF